MRPSVWSRIFLSASLLFSFSVARAAVPQRVGPIDDLIVTSLDDNVPAAAKRATDLGDAAPDSVLTDMSLRFTMTPAQQVALDRLLADQQNPASPQYQKWLTPEQFGAQFGLAAADLAKVSAWLSGRGFTVTQIARGGTFIRFSGTVAQARNAFHTQIHRVSLDGEEHIANLTAPTLPAAIAAVTGGITGLHDFHLKPHYRQMTVKAPESNGQPSPLFSEPTFTSSTSGNHFLAPGDFYTIYDVNSLLTSGITGTGVTVAVVGQTDINLSDIAAFRAVSGLAAKAPSITLYGSDPGQNSNDLIEAELDVEWTGATAPGANILYVNSTDVIDGSLTQAIDNNVAPIITDSYGICESAVGASLLNSYNALFKMANAQGQTILAAAGDSGATDCDFQVVSATQGLAVDFPAALPTVTGIGGTMFNEGTGTYFAATNGANGGSALSYIPEAAWNEDSTGGLGSGGGGISAFFTKPAWQLGTGVPADASRDVPDVSLSAAAGHDGYLLCTPGFCVNGYRSATGFLSVVGGTSVGAPSFAGLMALVEQKIGARVGNANPKIYALANSTFYGNVFHDTVVGNNASPCTAGSRNCPSGGTIGYAAGVGYDLATGWGSIDAFNLANDWNLVTAIGTGGGQTVSTVSLSGSATSVSAGTSITLTATAASGSSTTTATPTGTVQFLVDNVAVGSPVPLNNGMATFVLSTTTLSAGAHTVQAAYSGDATFSGSKATLAINITSSVAPDFTLTPSAASVTVRSGSTAQGIQFTVAAVNGFTGSVQLSASASGLNGGYAFSVDPVVLTSTTSSGTSILTLYAFVSNASPGSLQPVSSVRNTPAPWMQAGAGVALAGLLMIVLPKRRRMAALLAAVVSIGMIAAAGCGTGGNASTSSVFPTAPGTYTINVAATGTIGTSTVTHNSTVTFVVQ